MDRERFDAIIRMLAETRSRRGALAALAGALALGSGATADARRRKHRGQRKHARRAGGVQAAQVQVPANCFTGTRCIPGPGANLSKCDFGGSDILADANVKGTNLTNANLRGADASGADLRAANLGKACLVDADLTDADINSSTNHSGAIYCRTTMPDGSTNDSGCNRGARCCPTCIDVGDACGEGITGDCCDGEECREGFCGGCQNDDQCPGNRVCCDTVCCADEQVCRNGQCAEPNCQERCPPSCAVCLHRVGGGITCSGSEGAPRCGCNSNADCNQGDVCITGGTFRNEPIGFGIFCSNANGACATPTPCG